MREKGLLGWIADTLLRDSGEGRPSVDLDFLGEQDYELLETFVEVEGEKFVRCNLCGRVFEPEAVEDAVDHLAGHDEQIGEHIDPFSEIEGAEWDADYRDEDGRG